MLQRTRRRVAETDAASGNLADLRELGVRIAIDDFGTGYGSLAYLQRLLVDIVTIDVQIVGELGDRPRRAALATMILQLAAALDVVSVDERNEPPAHLGGPCELGRRLGAE